MNADFDAVFLRAREITDPAARAVYLAEACGDDSAQLDRLERMLADEAAADAFFSKPAVPAIEPPVPPREWNGKGPGTVIGRYRLLELIGEGGMGEVYLAEQQEPVVRRVALKIIKAGMDTKQVVARFEAERQALATMDHPGIAKVLDGGATETGRPYFVMELVHGQPVTRFCDEHRLSTEERLKLFIQICQAIQHAHQKGVIHRDLKPGNILVTFDGGTPVPKVIDFGIAKATAQPLTNKTLVTRLHEFLGTPAYMSPEQADFSATAPDTRSDIYALGALLYELMTGRTPLEAAIVGRASLAEIWRLIRETDPPKPSTRVGTLAEEERTLVAEARQVDPARISALLRGDLDWIVMKCLEKDRARRYAAASDLAADLKRHLNHEPVTARPPSRWYVWQKFARRHRGAVTGTVLTAVVLVLSLAVLVMANRRIRRETRDKEQALALAQTSERRAEERLFVSLKSQAEARRVSQRLGQRTESLAAIAEAARLHRDAELRDAAIAALAVPDLRLGPPWQAMGPDDLVVAFDADYARYARLDNQGWLSLRSVPEDRELQRFQAGADMPGTLWEHSLAFSSDGRFLARLGGGQRCQVWRVDHTPASLFFSTENVLAFAFSNDSARLAVARPDEIALFDLAEGREIRRWPLPRRPFMAAFSPDDRWLAVGPAHAGPAMGVLVFTVEDGALVMEIPAAGTADQMVAWHPTTKSLAISHKQHIELWDVTARARVTVLEGHAMQVTGLGFHPGGGLLFSHSWEGTPRLWQPSPRREWLRFFSAQTTVRFSRDGRWAGVAWPERGQARLIEALPSRECRTFPASPGDMTHSFTYGAFLAGGRVLAMASRDVTLRDLSGDGRERARLPTGYALTLTVPPAGDSLWVCAASSLQRWPVTLTPGGERDILRLGPRQTIPLPFATRECALEFDQAGQTLALTDPNAGEARLFDARAGVLREVRFPHPNLTIVALSPDGRRLATSGWHSHHTRLWDTQTGRMILETGHGTARVFFTPDSRELVVAWGHAYVFYDVLTAAETRRFPRPAGTQPSTVAFAPCATLMALEPAPGLIDLREMATGRLIASLRNPHGDFSSAWFRFTPDGTQLIAAANAIHRWDLRALRAGLQELGLDWDWPTFPPPSDAPPRPLTLEIVASEETR